ncbi:MAG: exonuclease domain-containing protein [Actinomycetia bacterium]|nr:exonuclease domain-containing protein [Actinomycetes bacterium]
MNPASPALLELLIPGTDPDIISQYASLSERARETRFGVLEADVIVLDTETTGLAPQYDKVIEVAAVRLRGPQVVDRFSSLVDPAQPIPAHITDLTGISDANVAGMPLIGEVLPRLAEFIGNTPIVAHNASFDHDMLAAAARGVVGAGHQRPIGTALQRPPATALQRPPATQSYAFIDTVPWCDSVELARISLPRCREHKLPALSEAFCDVRSSHRALDDVESLAQLWRVLLVAFSDLPAGLPAKLAGLFPQADWPLRPYLLQVAGSLPEAHFSLAEVRRQRCQQRPKLEKQDARDLFGVDPQHFPKLIDREQLALAFTPEGLLGQMYPDFESRNEQFEMALRVARALNESSHLAVEAGTGVGKSMAYLLPLALFARANGVCCGVATKTNTLLDQLLYNELPRFEQALPDGLAYEALKGYDHYPCLRKLQAQARQQQRQATGRDAAMLAYLLSFVSTSASGDLDHLSLHSGGLSRFEVVASAEDCLKRKCRYYQQCLLHNARRAAATSDIVLTNQALLFCDMMAGGGILPGIRHWVVDEAHGLEDEARSQLSYAVGTRELSATLEALIGEYGILKFMLSTARPLAGSGILAALTGQTLAESIGLIQLNRVFFSKLKGLTVLAEASSYDRIDLWINNERRQSPVFQDLASSGGLLHQRLEQLWKRCRDLVSLANEFKELLDAQADLAGLAAKLGDALFALKLVLDGDDPEYVYSAELDRRPGSANDHLLAARLDVGQALAEDFFPEEMSVILTSATLSTGDGFDYFAQGSGLAQLPREDWDSLQLNSSYDFDQQMAIYLAKDLPPPDSQHYLSALAELLFAVHTAMGGSVLTLFTNRRDMEKLYDSLHDRLDAAGIRLRCQWRSASRRLAAEFLADRELSLFALRSFWQGFDAPGETLRCVVIPKLPFGRPTDPLACERSQRQSGAWKRYVLPQAVIDLKQAAGRLIRSASDQGSLVLADSRLTTKWYGQAFLAALPSKQRYIMSTNEIAAALRERL